MIVATDTVLCWTYPKDGKTKYLSVERDEIPSNPIDDEENVHLTCWHRRYNLGHNHSYESPWQFITELARENNVAVDEDNDTISNVVNRLKEKVLILPLWMYEHSGISISCAASFDQKPGYPYNDPWDAGAVGFAWITKKEAIEQVGYSEDEWIEKASLLIQGVVETYNAYLNGDIYGYVLYEKEPDGSIKELDSVGGFYGSDVFENGMTDSVGEGLREAIKANEVEERGPLTQEELSGPPPMTISELETLMSVNDLSICTICDGSEGPVRFAVSCASKPCPDETACAADSIEQAVKMFLDKKNCRK